jgi:hypothetical protein
MTQPSAQELQKSLKPIIIFKDGNIRRISTPENESCFCIGEEEENKYR